MNSEWKNWIRESLKNGLNELRILKEVVTVGKYALSLATNEIEVQKGLIALEFSRFKRQLECENELVLSGRRCRVVYKSILPEIILFDGLLSDEECEHLISEGQKSMQRSRVVGKSASDNVVSDVRTSYGAFLASAQTQIIKTIEERMLNFMGWDPQCCEGIQILHYERGGEYKEHHDYFDDSIAGEEHKRRGGQRVGTFIMYLNDVEDGGETYFPYKTTSFIPKKGSVLFFAFNNKYGKVNPETLHAGMPVKRGEKWIATKWLREGVFN